MLAMSAARADHEPRWELGIGLGALHTPHYRGAKTEQDYLLPFPYAIYRGSFLQVDREDGVRGRLFRGGDVDLDLSLAGNVPVPDDDDGARSGMDELDPLVEFGAELKINLWRAEEGWHRFNFNIPLRMVYSVGDPLLGFQGVTLSPYLNYEIRHYRQAALTRYSLSVGPIFASERYHDYFYAVDAEFVTPERPEYEAEGGYGGSRVTLGLTHHFDEFKLGLFARYDSLDGAVFEDSPLVETSEYVVVGLVFGWILGESDASGVH